ncbi:MAG: hypothetical protein HKN11_12940, partial [Rhizobiales bacterium]|nr:hypothetical protein [Hyphomicrobiales bacterium]
EDAVILLADGRTRHPCKIIDRSEGGVQILVDRTVQLPDEFRIVTGTPKVHAVCHVAWRVGSHVGCEIIAQFCDDDTDGDGPAL